MARNITVFQWSVSLNLRGHQRISPVNWRVSKWVLGVSVCGLSNFFPLQQQGKAGALLTSVNKWGNGALGSWLKWVMRQVCAEASNESLTGNAGFYEEMKDEGEDKKRLKLRVFKKRMSVIEKEEVRRSTAVIHLNQGFRECGWEHKTNPVTGATTVCEPEQSVCPWSLHHLV